MCFLASLFGRLIFCLGVMITVVGCVVGSMIGSTGGSMMSGVTLIILGGAIYWFGSTKICQVAPRELNTIRISAKTVGANYRRCSRANLEAGREV